ncbi:phage tail tube protein [Herbaspirillum sp. GCM10030257]|uniref:phage tail tube protein n=1 Tax=Herbaspirillum sp. GCM10030257 TaxID=3273393 RepID=UPI003622CFB0
MSKLMRNMLVVIKPETVYGTDAGPTAAANAILCRGITPQPLVGEFVERSLVRPFLGNSGSINVANHSEIELEVEIASSGTPGDAPKWGPLLRACAFSETIVADESVTYAPITAGQESATIWAYVDGILHKLTGARGSVALALSAKGIPAFKFKFVGLYSNGADSPMPTDADYSGFTMPLAINKTNVPTWTLHGVSAAMQSFDIDIANQVIFRSLVNQEGVYITDRKPSGSASFEMPSLAAKNWFQTTIAGTEAPLAMTIGATPGRIIEISGPKVQISNPQYQDSEGILMLNTTLAFNPNVGNDELIIVAK